MRYIVSVKAPCNEIFEAHHIAVERYLEHMHMYIIDATPEMVQELCGYECILHIEADQVHHALDEKNKL